MASKKRTSHPHRNRKRIKPDVLTLSLCQNVVINDFGGPDQIGTCFNPSVDAIALCIGGKSVQNAAIQASATPLSDEGARGTGIRGIQFDWGGYATCWLSQGAIGVRVNEGISVTMYAALIKAEYDVVQYEQTGIVQPTWPRIPNIILSGEEIAATLQNRPMADPVHDIFWRGMREAFSFNCQADCYPVEAEGCISTASGTVQTVLGLVNDIKANHADLNYANHYPMRHVRVRTGRFLKENEAIFWVRNWTMAGIPSDLCQVGWVESIYGTALARLAR